MSQAQRRVPLTELRERVPTASTSDRHYTNAERRLPPRLHQSVRRVVPRPPSNAASSTRTVQTSAASFPSTAAQGASFSGFSEQSKPMRRVIPNCPNQCGEFPQTATQGSSFSGFTEQSKPVRRVNPLIVPSTAASPSDRAQGTSSHSFHE